MVQSVAVPLDDKIIYGDFRDILAKDGFVVVPGVIPRKRALSYADRCQDWLESFELGYKRDDPTTWKIDNLPMSFKGGLYNRYGVAHEQVVWDIRQEPGVIEPFERIWQTKELLVSFDGINISVPGAYTETDMISRPWPHVDQSPLRPWLHCIQGIVNLVPNGEKDGGLMVMKGSRLLFDELFDTFKKDMPEGGWSEKDVYVFSDEQMAWLHSKGCSWHKVTAQPGDLILWDSRTCHYGALPQSTNFRIATYVCYKPVAHATPEQLLAKQAAFMDYSLKLTHDPITPGILSAVPDDLACDPAYAKKQAPSTKAIISEIGLKLAGIMPY